MDVIESRKHVKNARCEDTKQVSEQVCRRRALPEAAVTTGCLTEGKHREQMAEPGDCGLSSAVLEASYELPVSEDKLLAQAALHGYTCHSDPG
ncbi:hypothetical protein EXN66_Car005042 [Channa argus]|uniref:Uncharacterized protein n=1 Tax=Channa argus TaxID=215402 RepID=A0A6G1PGE1_CHAAH|nr:hypothetical protein EXN66_Car005042 [Channa argus]